MIQSHFQNLTRRQQVTRSLKDLTIQKSGTDQSISANFQKKKEPQYSEDLQIDLQMASNSSQRQRKDKEENGNRKNWSESEDQALITLHNSIGNCWTEIGIQLSKDHNTVKNHFYAQIRKSIRRINFFVDIYFHRKYKQLNLSQISKAITLLSEKKKYIPNLTGLSIFSDSQIENLKFSIFYYAKFDENCQLNSSQIEKLDEFISQITDVVSKLKNKGLIGKKSSPLKQAKQKNKNSVRQSGQSTLSKDEKTENKLLIKKQDNEPEKRSNNKEANFATNLFQFQPIMTGYLPFQQYFYYCQPNMMMMNTLPINFNEQVDMNSVNQNSYFEYLQNSYPFTHQFVNTAQQNNQAASNHPFNFFLQNGFQKST